MEGDDSNEEFCVTRGGEERKSDSRPHGMSVCEFPRLMGHFNPAGVLSNVASRFCAFEFFLNRRERSRRALVDLLASVSTLANLAKSSRQLNESMWNRTGLIQKALGVLACPCVGRKTYQIELHEAL
jgi:hypothetical protein